MGFLDPDALEMVQYFIVVCPMYSKQRLEVETKIDTRITKLNLSRTNSGRNRSIFPEYCKKVS